MSINITVHGNTLETVTRRNMLCDPEHMKKEEFAERRRQRLEQVRQQSKELASQVRRNVDQEIRKQERRVEDVKQKELLKWREKAMAEAQDQHKKSLSALGGAHRAALEDRDANEKFKVHQKKNELVAVQRGKDALRKELQEKSQPRKKISKTVAPKPVLKKTAPKNDENSSNLANAASTVQQPDDSICTSSSDEDDAPVQIEHSKAALKKTKVVVMEVNSDSDSSATSLQDSHADSNMHFYRTANKSETAGEPSSKRSSYNAIDYKASDTSSERSNAIEHQPPRLKQFTQISDMIRKRQGQSSSDLLAEPSSSNLSPPKTRQSSLKSRLPLETITSKSETQTSKKLTNSATKSSSKSESSNTVQFYDYDNKFAKQYEPRSGVVLPNSKPHSEMNAMESARLELLLQEKQRKSADDLRVKAEERCQKAIERENIRRDCQLLTQQLDALNQDKGIMREAQEKVNVFSQNKIQQTASNRQKKMTSAVEKILERPVIITCPEVKQRELPTNGKPAKSSAFNVASCTDINNCDDLDGLNASDSCASILLNYVDNQSKQISQDIGKCDNIQTASQLKCLLSKINDLRQQLLVELNNCSKQPKEIVDMENIAHSVSDLRKQRESILSGEAKSMEHIKADLEKRERRLKRKEEQIEKKLKAFIESQAEKKQQVTTESSKAPQPVQIIIKLKDETMRKTTRSPYKSPRKRSSLIDIKHTKRKKIVLVKQNESSPNKENKLKFIEREQHIVQAPSTSSTSYLSPPDVVHTKLGNLLTQRSSQSQRNELTKKQNEPKVDACKKTISNPLLTHYIQRLLGMSRNSIDMLGVSSSEITTPSSSLINNPANLSTTDSDFGQKERMERLQEFINENYSFLSELEESMKSSKSLSSSNDSANKTIEKIWLQALKKKEMNDRRDHEKDIKPILKKKTQLTKNKSKSPDQISKCDSQSAEHAEKQPDQSKSPLPSPAVKDQHETTGSEKLQLVGKYTELTENCTKRIAELTEMINKVRREKQKILEITLTSGSETGRNSTEYMDFAENRSNKSEDNSSKLVDAKNSLRSEGESEKANLEKNKLTGMSRDSGISLSRPVTALDTHDVFGRFTPEQQFEPILKDIPKLAPQISPKLPSMTMTFDNAIAKRLRPPTSMTRYSPQLVEEAPHELSTILEVETPATSRLNASVNEKQTPYSAIELTNREKVSYKKFPTYEQYAEEHNLDLSQFETSSKLQEVINISDKGKLEYEEFPTLNTYLQDFKNNKHDHISIRSQADINLSYQRFPTHKSYAELHDISGLLDTQSIEAISISDNTNKPEAVESGESLPDVVAELKKRNILKHSFRNEDESDAVSLRSGPFKRNSSTFPSSSVQDKSKSKSIIATSPTRNESPPMKTNTPTKNKIQIISHPRRNESPLRQARNVDLTGIEMLQSSSSKSTPDDIEKDLDRMGLKWASIMLKKSQQSMELSSTSSSFNYAPRRKSPRKGHESKTTISSEKPLLQAEDDIKFETPIISNESSNGSMSRPLNLREFLTKELQKRTNTSNSLTSSDDSLASQFLRSLMGSANSTPKLSLTEKLAQDRHRTSTPILALTSSTSKPSHESSKLFSGESCLSSVRPSSATSREISNAGQSNTSDDVLTIPDMKLDFNN